MSDANLLVFGCGVSMIVAAGVYVYFRERFTAGDRVAEATESAARGPRKAATRRVRKAA